MRKTLAVLDEQLSAWIKGARAWDWIRALVLLWIVLGALVTTFR